MNKNDYNYILSSGLDINFSPVESSGAAKLKTTNLSWEDEYKETYPLSHREDDSLSNLSKPISIALWGSIFGR